MSVAVVNLPDQRVGDTFRGMTVKFKQDDDSYVDFTGATLKAQFREWSPTGKLVKTIESGSGLSVSDGTDVVYAPFTPDFGPGVVYHDLQATWPDSSVQTLLAGQWNLCQDVTQ